MNTYDAKTSVQLLCQGGPFWYKFAHAGRKQTAAEIRKLIAHLDAVMAKPQNSRKTPQDAVIFIKALVDDSSDERLLATWREAMDGLEGIQAYQYQWGSKQKTNKLQSLAKNPRLVAAWQASAVGSQCLPRDVLALLVIEASEGSVDALMPHFERALGDHDKLEQLEGVQRYETPATSALFARVRGALATNRASSPVLALGERLGLASKGRFKLKVEFRATKAVKRFTYDVISLEFDSNEQPGFTFNYGQEERRASSTSSWWRGVECAIDEVPKHIAKLAKKQNVEWDFEHAVTRPLGAKKAAPLLTWLQRD